MICVFMFANGVPAIKEIGITKFLFEHMGVSTQNLFGIGPMIVGSIYVNCRSNDNRSSNWSLTAVFFAKYCPKNFINLSNQL